MERQSTKMVKLGKKVSESIRKAEGVFDGEREIKTLRWYPFEKLIVKELNV